MKGPELGVHADDIETSDVEKETKQEVLENKNVISYVTSNFHRAVNT
jgi:hypothetical protein